MAVLGFWKLDHWFVRHLRMLPTSPVEKHVSRSFTELRSEPGSKSAITPRSAKHQADALVGRKSPHSDIRGPAQPTEGEVSLRVWANGGIDSSDPARREALEDDSEQVG
ncbi:hypothetical protein Slala03_80400 [Streptomyces lavendulae subsp. lavendulae]|nr:hypothetical protein Slala03_80400 [Streptomyces lavendulae subsp. lavendulae]